MPHGLPAGNDPGPGDSGQTSQAGTSGPGGAGDSSVEEIEDRDKQLTLKIEELISQAKSPDTRYLFYELRPLLELVKVTSACCHSPAHASHLNRNVFRQSKWHVES